MIDGTLDWLRSELEGAYGLTDYVLFGSAVLYLHGLRDPETVGDVDVFVSRRVWEHFTDPRFRLGVVPEWSVREPRRGDPPFLLSTTSPPVSAFYDWTRRDAWMSPKRCFADAERVRGWNCVSLETLRHHKRHANRQESKHERDLRVLDYVLA
jgi:hypothetical protein